MITVYPLLSGLMSLSASPHSVPFSWDTIPRYTFCVNSSSTKTITNGLFNDAAAKYISKQPIYLNNPTLQRPPGGNVAAEDVMPLQAARCVSLYVCRVCVCVVCARVVVAGGGVVLVVVVVVVVVVLVVMCFGYCTLCIVCCVLRKQIVSTVYICLLNVRNISVLCVEGCAS